MSFNTQFEYTCMFLLACLILHNHKLVYYKKGSNLVFLEEAVSHSQNLMAHNFLENGKHCKHCMKD